MILANKQDLPGAREPKELEKLLSLHELSPIHPLTSSGPAIDSLSTTGSPHQSSTAKTPGDNIIRKEDCHTQSSNTITSILNTASTTAANSSTTVTSSSYQNYKGWHIQPACAITGEGLQEGLEALHEMIVKKRKMNKVTKKKR